MDEAVNCSEELFVENMNDETYQSKILGLLERLGEKMDLPI